MATTFYHEGNISPLALLLAIIGLWLFSGILGIDNEIVVGVAYSVADVVAGILEESINNRQASFLNCLLATALLISYIILIGNSLSLTFS